MKVQLDAAFLRGKQHKLEVSPFTLRADTTVRADVNLLSWKGFPDYNGTRYQCGEIVDIAMCGARWVEFIGVAGFLMPTATSHYRVAFPFLGSLINAIERRVYAETFGTDMQSVHAQQLGGHHAI